MSSVVQLESSLRESLGKGPSRLARRNKQVPAIIYGGGGEAVPILLEEKRMHALYYAGSFKTTVFSLTINGEQLRCIPKALDLHPVTGRIQHIDFMRLVKGHMISLELPVHFINEDNCPGIRKSRGSLNIVLHSVSLRVPSEDIPDHLTIDLTDLEIGHVIHINDAKLPPGAVHIGEEDVIATIVPPMIDGEEGDQTETSES